MRRPALIELPRIYTDDDFRDRVLAYVEDPIILRFWRQEYAGSGRRPPPRKTRLSQRRRASLD
jgi:hypothetical protein